MRRDPTPSEDRLWQAIRGRGLGGLKFRRQHAIERFIVDFYCVSARLVVEVDGPIHADRVDPDRERQQFLEGLGLKVLRLSSDEVLTDLPRALAKIEQALGVP
jgi:very-short-patch-repair endonuclease